MNQRPLSVTIIAWLYIAAGAIGFVYHLNDFGKRQPFDSDFVWVELVRVTAILCGVYMLRGHDWARWLALAWIGYHAILSAFHTMPELAVHVLFLAIVAYCLFRPAASRYFRGARAARRMGGLA